MPDSGTRLWVVGRTVGDSGDNWEFQGIFDAEDKAIAACYDNHCWVGPCLLNQEAPRERIKWPDAWFPLVTVL